MIYWGFILYAIYILHQMLFYTSFPSSLPCQMHFEWSFWWTYYILIFSSPFPRSAKQFKILFLFKSLDIGHGKSLFRDNRDYLHTIFYSLKRSPWWWYISHISISRLVLKLAIPLSFYLVWRWLHSCAGMLESGGGSLVLVAVPGKWWQVATSSPASGQSVHTCWQRHRGPSPRVQARSALNRIFKLKGSLRKALS